MPNYRVTKFIRPNGERYPILVDGENMPVFYPTLFATSQIRNSGLASATMEQALTAIKVLLVWCDKNAVDLKCRILNRTFLSTGELDGLADAAGTKRRGHKNSKVISLKKGWTRPAPKVDSATKNIYLLRIADFVKWLSDSLLASDRFTRETSDQIDKLVSGIKARMMKREGRNIDDEAKKGLTPEQEIRLFEVLTPGSTLNPFNDHGIQVRNYLLIKLLRLLGTRGGEILNLKINDIDWTAKHIKIIRRADTKADTRTRQPNAKTKQRILPLADSTLAEIREYIVGVRKNIPNSDFCKYLLVAHKSGPTQGKALSVSSLQGIFATIRASYPELNITPHDLRHYWNWTYSEAMAAQDRIGYLEAQQLRKLLAGWSLNSKMDAHYDATHIRKQAHEAMLLLQKQAEQIVRERKQKLLDQSKNG